MYDGFISYSHSADDLLAPRLQAGLQRFAKPWWKRRAVRMFRDESSLAANPHLWSSIVEALDSSDWFVLLLSEDAASSEWVGKEIEHWVANHDPSKILPVVTSGEFGWNNGDVAGSSAPPALHGVFSEEPRWVDLRFARGDELLDLKNPDFSAAIADVASAIRGVPKDELASEEVRQHRRTIRTAWAAGVLVAVLGVAAVVFGIQSADNAEIAEANAAEAQANAEAEAEARQEAETQRNLALQNEQAAITEAARADQNADLAKARELAASAIGVLGTDPELATLLALQAIEATPGVVEQPIEVINALWRGASENRLVEILGTDHTSILSLSPDGGLLAVTTDHNALELKDSSTGKTRWSYTEDTVDFFTYSDFSSDGRLALSIIDSSAQEAPARVSQPDDFPNRIVVLDVESGEVLRRLEFPDCNAVEVPSWSPDGALLALGSGAEGCLRDGALNWIEIYDTSTWDSIAFLPVGGEDLGPIARWDEAGNLMSLRPYGEAVIFEGPDYGTGRVLDAAGIGDISPDGSKLVLSFTGRDEAADFDVLVFDTASEALLDVYPGVSNPSVPRGVLVEPTGFGGQFAFIGTGASTVVYDLQRGSELFALPSGDVFSLAYDPGRSLLYTSGDTEDVRVWDMGRRSVGLESTGELGRFPYVNGNSFSVGPDLGALNAIDAEFATWSIQLFDLVSGQLRPEGYPGLVQQGLLSNGRLVAFDFAEQGVVLLEPETGERIVLDGCEESGIDDNGEQVCLGTGDPSWYSYVVAADGSHIVGVGHGEDGEPTGEVALLDADTGEVFDRFDGPPLPRRLITEQWAIGPLRGGVAAVDRTTGDYLYELAFTQHFELSPDGSLLAMNPKTTDLLLVDTQTWEEVLRVPGTDRIRGIAFNTEGSRLAVSGLESLYVVDLSAHQVVEQLRFPGISDSYWIDDETLLVGTNDGQFGTISMSTEAFLGRVRENLRRGFSEQECSLYRIEPCPSLEELRAG